jgi:hypothetical protein
MCYNRSGARRTARLKRNRREVQRLTEKNAPAGAEARSKGGQPTGSGAQAQPTHPPAT